MRAWFLLPILLFLIACGGGSADATDDSSAPASPGIPPSQSGPPAPPPGPVVPEVSFDPRFLDLGKPGAFPSDLARDAQGSLYVATDAAIPATFRRYAANGTTTDVTIAAANLIDSDGTTPATAPAAFDFAGGLFGAFTGDIAVADNRWAFVTVGAGNSLSGTGGRALSLSNVVLIDTWTGSVVQTVNAGWDAHVSGMMNVGGPFDRLPQSLPSQVAYVPDSDFPGTGRLYVAMSNGAGTSNGLTAWFPGTVQVWRVDFSRAEPVFPETSGRDPHHPTKLFVSSHYNPVGLTIFSASHGGDFLLLTNAGASRFNASFQAVPEGSAFLEVLDLSTRVWRPELEMNLGPSLPAAQKLALGRDGTGRPFGAFSSQTLSAVSIVDLSGLDARPPRADRLGLLRTVDLVPGGGTTIGSGFHPGIGATASGRMLVVSTFFPAKLFVVELPADLSTGAIAVDPSPFGSANLTADDSGGLGALVVPDNNVSDVYFLVNGTFDFSTFSPKDPAYIGTLTTRDGLR